MATEKFSVEDVKTLIIESLNLEGMTPDMIENDQPLFGDGLGLDSVDALELVVAMEKSFNIKIDSNEMDREAFATANSLAAFVQSRIQAAAEAPA